MMVMLKKKKQDDGTTTIIREEKKKNDDHNGIVSFGFITNCYKPLTSFLLVAALGATTVPFHSWVWLQLTTCLVLWMSTWVMAESWNTTMMRPRDIQRSARGTWSRAIYASAQLRPGDGRESGWEAKIWGRESWDSADMAQCRPMDNRASGSGPSADSRDAA